MTLKDLGEAFIALGRALLDDSSTLEELTDLAMKAGVQLQFRIVPTTPETDTDG